MKRPPSADLPETPVGVTNPATPLKFNKGRFGILDRHRPREDFFVSPLV